MYIGVEIGTFDHDVVLALNYTVVFKVSFVPERSVSSHISLTAALLSIVRSPTMCH